MTEQDYIQALKKFAQKHESDFSIKYLGDLDTWRVRFHLQASINVLSFRRFLADHEELKIALKTVLEEVMEETQLMRVG